MDDLKKSSHCRGFVEKSIADGSVSTDPITDLYGVRTPSKKDIKIESKQARIKLLDILSKIGGEYSTGMGLKGKGFTQSDLKKKFKEASKKVYDAITSDEAKLLGKNALVTIILATMGYGASKLFKKPQMGEIQKSAQDIEHDIKIRDLELKSKELKDRQDEEFNKIIKKMQDKKQREKAHKTKYPVQYGIESDSEEEYHEVQTTNPAIVKPTNAGRLKGGKWTTQNIKDYLHKVVTSKEAKILGATALSSLILAGLGIAGHKALKRKSPWEAEIDAEYIENMRKAKAVKENLHEIKNNIRPIKKATAVVDILEEELEQQMEQSIKPDTFEEEEEEDERRYALNIPLSTLATNKTIAELEEMYKKIESDNMTKPIAKKMADNLVDSIIQTEVKSISNGKGLKGKGFNNDVKKVKDKIYKIITSPEAKTVGMSALSTLILTALGGLGYYASNKYNNNLKLAEDERKQAAEREFIEKQKADWGVEETPYKEGERASHFVGEGLSDRTQSKGLKIASKKIANLIQYARDLNLDKVAMASLITFLLGGAGYGGFKYISKKARESEPIGYVPEDEVRQALEDFATGKHRMAERIKADTKDANLPWSGFGLKQKLKGGDLSKFGEYAKKKEEAEKNAKPIAQKITDWIYSDEAKLIGKAAIQYSILAALGLLTAYAGKKAGEAAISAIPKDRTKINDPEGIMRGFREHAPTGDLEKVTKEMRQKATDDRIRSAFKEASPTSDEILNLKRFALENPKNKAVQLYLQEKGYDQPFSEDIMRMDPRLATLFNLKADKPTKQKVHKYYPDTFTKFKEFYDLGKKAQDAKYLKEAESGNQTRKNEKLEEESKEANKHLKEFIDKNLPKEAGSDIDVAIKALEEVEQNQPSGIVQPKKLDKSLLAKFSGTSAPMPNIKKLTNKEKNEMMEGIDAILFEKGDGLKKNKGKGFKEDLNSFSKSSIKNINKVGDAIYKVISSNEVKGVAGGVTAGLIVSILSMLMHEKRQAVLAARRAAPARPPRGRPNYPAPPPPTRGDNEFNPFATV